ncbi:hypothetical protein [Halomonas elongata]|uniref:hypothetical protein n=1 Tax=Halomonas elongata TaxID=2746 RepID=UPI004034AD7E
MNKWVKVACCSLLVVAIFLPIGLYIKVFGVGLWDKHEDWARMGSFFGGILGPIITGSTLVFLGMQIKLQSQQRRDEEVRHICSECERDILKALPIIEEFFVDGENISKIQQQWEKYRDAKKAGDKEKAFDVAKEAFSGSFYFLASWSQVEVSLSKLKDLNPNKYNVMRWHIFSRLDVYVLGYVDSLRSEQLSCSPVLFEQAHLDAMLMAREG